MTERSDDPAVRTLLEDGARRLADAGVETPRGDAELLLAHVLRTDRAGLYARTRALTGPEAAGFEELLARRAERVPLQHLTGETGFFGLRVSIRPGVFVPRPETETLVEATLEVLEGNPGPRVVDVCTGAGAVALAVKAARPDARVVGVDASEDAVVLARENAAHLDLDLTVLRGDLLDPVPPELAGRLDAVVANPPYVTPQEYQTLPPEVLADPRPALLGGTDLHARLAAEARALLRPGGWLLMEIGAHQGAEVAGLLSSYEAVEVLPDLAGLDRVVRGRAPDA